MMGIVVSETCSTYKQYNKIISGVYMVHILQLSQWCAARHTSNRKERCFVWRFPAFACLSLAQEQPYDEAVYGSLAEWCWQEETEIFRHRPVLVSPCPPQIWCWSARCLIQPTNVHHASLAPRCVHSNYRLNLLIYFVIRKLTEKRREFNLETNKFSSLHRNFV